MRYAHPIGWLSLLVALCVTLTPTGASAQAVESYQLRHYAVGATEPVQTDAFAAAAASCDQPDHGPASTVNPTRVIFADPNNAGRFCIYQFATGSPLFSLPVGNYEGALVAINQGGASGESPRAPFSRLSAPPVPTAFRYGR